MKQGDLRKAMKRSNFKADILDFVGLYCEDSFQKKEVTYDIDDSDGDITAKIKLTDDDGNEWSVSVAYDCDNCIGIDIGDAGFLALDDGGLFRFLWYEAKVRGKLISHVKRNI